MRRSYHHIVRAILPLLLTFTIVLAGLTLLIVRQNNFRSFEHGIDLQIQNITAKQDLGQLIVGDLEKTATYFYMILVSADPEQQKVLLDAVKLRIAETHAVLNVLSDGGTISRDLPLNLPTQDTPPQSITYLLENKQQYNLEVLALRPQLVVLEEKLEQSINMTTLRNRLLNNPEGNLLQETGLQLRLFAKHIHSQLDRMTENANKLAYDTNQELLLFQNKIAAAQKQNQEVEMLWAIGTVLCVFGFIGVVYREILASQRKLENTVLQLKQIEHDLQESHSEVLTLNQSLEEQVLVRTEELELSERLWVDAFNSVTSSIFLHDQEGRIIKANRAYLKLAECSFENAFGQFYWDIFPKQQRALPGCFVDIAKGKADCQTVEQDVLVGGRTFRSQSYAIYDDLESYLYSMHYMEDVTEQRKAGQALRESEQRFREVTNSLSDVLILIDQDMKVQLLNDAAIRTYGIVDKNYIGKQCHEVFWDCGDICDNCPTLSVMRTGKVVKAMRYIGDDTILDRSIYPVHDPTGKIIACAVIASDVTEREKQIERLMRFEQIMSTSTDLVAFFDYNHVFLAANSVYSSYFGVDPEDIIGQHAEEIVGTERYQGYLKYQDTIFNKKKSLIFKAWAVYPKMGKRHMETTFDPYFEDDGTVSGFVSRSKDITEQTEQEAKLRLSAKVFESTSEGIIITDKNGIIVVVNAAFSEITGYSENEVLGCNPNILQSGRHKNNFYQDMWHSLDKTGQWRGEIWNKRKNGVIYPEFLTISSIKNDEGETINYVAIFSDITPIKQAVERLEYQAHHHPLTGLPNRLLLHARLEHSIQYAKREKEQGAVLFLDLDNFKKINDSLGHNAGDTVLKEVALRLQKHSREVDTVSHLSGDEFVIVLQGIRTIHDATSRAQQILDSLQQPFTVDEYELYVSGSIGIVGFSGESEDIEGLLKNADSAMYKAKEGGKNCYQLYSSELTDTAIEKVLLESHLRRALERNELVLHYQPQMALPAGDIVAVEALVRWQHPDLGLIPPDKFIPLSEETGLIIPMGEWILKTACEQLLIWREQGSGLRRIAVNLSGKQIQQKNLPEMVAQILLETGCPSDSLELEITEGFIMQHPEQSISVLQQIRALGVELSVDDFGTGHSSLNYLKKLPINRLKIDRSFVWDIGESPDGEVITKAIIAMGHSLNLQITGEGIETPEQLEFLELHGCNEAQGYLFSRPLPAEDIGKLMK